MVDNTNQNEVDKIKEQAVALFAGGEINKVVELLVAYLNKVAGKAPKEVWLMLIDGYQSLNHQTAFNEAALLYAKAFKTSPPSWEEFNEEEKENVKKDVLNISGPIHSFDKSHVTEFIVNSRQTKEAKLDLSRTEFRQQSDDLAEDVRLLWVIMKSLRQHKIKIVLMGENKIVESLRQVIQENKKIPNQQFFWFLLLEFLQWRGHEEAYENLAFSFAKQFGTSAPGYEFNGVIAKAPVETKNNSIFDGQNPPMVLSDENIGEWLGELEKIKPSFDEVVYVNFKYVKAMSYNAALALLQKLNEWKISPQSMVFQMPSELMNGLFERSGIKDLVHVEPRKR